MSYFCFIVTNSNYEDVKGIELKNLPTAKNDGDLIYSLMIGNAGFNKKNVKEKSITIKITASKEKVIVNPIES